MHTMDGATHQSAAKAPSEGDDAEMAQAVPSNSAVILFGVLSRQPPKEPKGALKPQVLGLWLCTVSSAPDSLASFNSTQEGGGHGVLGGPLTKAPGVPPWPGKDN